VSVDLAWHAYGDGPPVVILHGLFGAGRNWRRIAEGLAAEGRRVYTVDLRNHGASPWTDEMSYAAMADDLAAFFMARGLYSATLIGHSLGGKTAMTFALDRPPLVEDLVVVDIAPVPYDHDYRPLIEAMRAIDVKRLKRRSEAEAQLAPAVAEPAMRAFLVQNLRHAPDGGFVWRINLAAIAASLPALLGWPEEDEREYPNRALFVRGALSDYINRANHAAIFRSFPQAEVAVIEGAGHRVHADQPEAFLAAVSRFLTSATA
jgi:esterase